MGSALRLSRPALACAAALTAAVLAAPTGARAANTRLSDRVEFGPGSGATQAVREECGLQSALPQMLRDAGADVELVPGSASGPRTLELAITEVHAPGGGPFTGPKWMEVRATLRENGRTVATARSKRMTGEPFGGTCDQLRKVSRAIASDLAAWLASPTSDAQLGDQ